MTMGKMKLTPCLISVYEANPSVPAFSASSLYKRRLSRAKAT